MPLPFEAAAPPARQLFSSSADQPGFLSVRNAGLDPAEKTFETDEGGRFNQARRMPDA